MKQLIGFIISLLSLTLIGCEDLMELEKQSYVIAVGVDLTEQEGLFQFTFQIANPKIDDASGGATQTISIPTSDLITATDIANNFVTKKINLDHTRVIIISEELARTGQFISILQPSSRTTQMRRNIQIIVTKEKAETFLRIASPELENKPHKYYQFMITRASETGVIPEADFHHFFQITEGKDDLFLAIFASAVHQEEDLSKPSIEKIAGELITTGGNPAQFMGSAVFKNGKMIDILNAQETRMTTILDKTKKMDDIISAFPDPINPTYNIAGNFIQKEECNIDIKYDAENNHASINVFVPFEFETVAIPSMIRYSDDNELKKILKKALEEHYQSIAEKLIIKTQQQYQAEPFYWSLFIRKFFNDIPSYEEANWSEDIYPNADINVVFQLQRLEFGKSLYDTNLNEMGD
ncbi:Ger(x)C family spore germination protein [Amphibacillus indicireducens]